MMKDYYQQSIRALQLAGMSKPTQKGYTRSVRMLVDFYGKTPDLITEQELQEWGTSICNSVIIQSFENRYP